LLHTITLRALCSANVVSWRSKFCPNETRVLHQADRPNPLIGLRTAFGAEITRKSFTLSVGTPLCYSGIAYGRDHRSSISGSFQKPLLCTLCGMPKQALQYPETALSFTNGTIERLLVKTGTPLSSVHGTLLTLKARFWPWLSGRSP
jgi:hypothetical protein